MSWTDDDFLPAAPLLARIPEWKPARGVGAGMDGYASMGGVHGSLPPHLWRAVYRIRKAGRVTYAMADEICFALGIGPPTNVYGPRWYDPDWHDPRWDE